MILNFTDSIYKNISEINLWDIFYAKWEALLQVSSIVWLMLFTLIKYLFWCQDGHITILTNHFLLSLLSIALWTSIETVLDFILKSTLVDFLLSNASTHIVHPWKNTSNIDGCGSQGQCKFGCKKSKRCVKSSKSCFDQNPLSFQLNESSKSKIDNGVFLSIHIVIYL